MIVRITILSKGQTYLEDTIGTSGHPHDFNYLCEIVADAMNVAEKRYFCHVGSFVIDNAANVTKIRDEFKNTNRSNINIITYGCSVHIFNLLAKDIKISCVKTQ